MDKLHPMNLQVKRGIRCYSLRSNTSSWSSICVALDMLSYVAWKMQCQTQHGMPLFSQRRFWGWTRNQTYSHRIHPNRCHPRLSHRPMHSNQEYPSLSLFTLRLRLPFPMRFLYFPSKTHPNPWIVQCVINEDTLSLNTRMGCWLMRLLWFSAAVSAWDASHTCFHGSKTVYIIVLIVELLWQDTIKMGEQCFLLLILQSQLPIQHHNNLVLIS